MQSAKDKIQLEDSAQEQIEQWKEAGKKIVFTNGCFDLLHLGHVDYLEKARNLGDALVVGINSDASIQKIKGPLRPIVDQASRSRVMASLACVDLVVVFDDPTPLDLITKLAPDVLVKGDDYLADDIVGAKIVQSKGGQVSTVPLVQGYSTSKIIDRILKTH